MPSTTNFGWTTPADTDYVKDGALAIRTLGNGIDTSLLDLKGGTTGQILSKASNTDLDYTWINNDQGDITEVAAGTGISVTSGTGPIPTVAIDSTVATLTGTQTLTNKTLALGSNTVSGTTAQFNTALTDGDFATLAGSETLTNKTIAATSNTITGVINNTLTTTTGDIIYASSANTPARLGIGSTGQVLTVSGGVPSWATSASGGWTQISSQALSGSSISFTSISGSYYQLVLVIQDWVMATDNTQMLMRYNSDSGSNYYQYLYANSNGTQENALSNPNTGVYLTTYQVDNSDFNCLSIYTITDYANTNSVKIATGNSYYKRNSTNAYAIDGQVNAWSDTSAITSISLSPVSGNFSQGTAILYGVK